MTYSSIFGTLTGRDQVGTAVVNLLQTPPAGTNAYPLLVYFLAEVERQQGLNPHTIPVPATFRTGVDFENWSGADLPLLTVVAQPTGDAERYDMGTYGQWYQIQVGATVEDPESGDEQTAQKLADWYGAAVMGCLAKNGGLGNQPGVSVEKTVLTQAPRTDLLPDAQRWIALSTVTVHSFVEQVVTEQGPTSYGPDPYVAPSAWPTVSKIVTQLQSKDPLNNTSPGTGINVTSSTGHVVVNE